MGKAGWRSAAAAVPSPANVPAFGLITSGEGVGDDLSGDDEAAPSSSSGDSLRVAKDPHDFLGFWDPGNLNAIRLRLLFGKVGWHSGAFAGQCTRVGPDKVW